MSKSEHAFAAAASSLANFAAISAASLRAATQIELDVLVVVITDKSIGSGLGQVNLVVGLNEDLFQGLEASCSGIVALPLCQEFLQVRDLEYCEASTIELKLP